MLPSWFNWNDVISLEASTHLHSRTAHRHAGHSQSLGIGWRISQKLRDQLGWHVAFKRIAFRGDRCMAGLQFWNETVLQFDGIQIPGWWMVDW